MKLLLASASPARLATLRSAGITALVEVSEVDEPALLAAHPDVTDPAGQVRLLAQGKAREVAGRIRGRDVEHGSGEGQDDAGRANRVAGAEPAPAKAAAAGSAERPDVVVGCDSMLHMDGKILGKPGTKAKARERLHEMSGRSGVLYTGHCVIDLATGREEVAHSAATVHIAELTEAEIEAYAATGEPEKVAGSFTIDGYGGSFVTGIEGDPHGVVGISLPLLRQMLAKLGYSITEFWDA